MSQGNLAIRNTYQYFNVLIDEISGSGGFDSPQISVPVKIEFNPINDNSITSFEVMSVKGELYATEKNFKISENIQLSSWRISGVCSNSIYFRFLLNAEIISRIEKYRKGNIPFQLSITIQVGLFIKIPGVYQGKDADRFYIAGFENGSGNVSFQVEQSQWVNKILSKVGHDSYKLIELPASNTIIPKEYKKSLVEFDEARKYFVNGDYDKVVAHCRSALDPFGGKTNLPKLREFVKSKSEFAWASSVLEATDEWLDKIIKATSNFTSKAHHAPSVGHFSRTEAEIILMITTGIIAYIGKIEYKPID